MSFSPISALIFYNNFAIYAHCPKDCCLLNALPIKNKTSDLFGVYCFCPKTITCKGYVFQKIVYTILEIFTTA